MGIRKKMALSRTNSGFDDEKKEELHVLFCMILILPGCYYGTGSDSAP